RTAMKTAANAGCFGPAGSIGTASQAARRRQTAFSTSRKESPRTHSIWPASDGRCLPTRNGCTKSAKMERSALKRWAPRIETLMEESNLARLEGKVILINGAGSGIGKACAEEYAREGAKVIVASQSRSSEKVAQGIVDAGGDARSFSADISDEAAVKAMVEFALDTYGRTDVLHNNAAMTGNDIVMRDLDIATMDVDLWDRTMAVNLRGPML